MEQPLDWREHPQLKDLVQRHAKLGQEAQELEQALKRIDADLAKARAAQDRAEVDGILGRLEPSALKEHETRIARLQDDRAKVAAALDAIPAQQHRLAQALSQASAHIKAEVAEQLRREYRRRVKAFSLAMANAVELYQAMMACHALALEQFPEPGREHYDKGIGMAARLVNETWRDTLTMEDLPERFRRWTAQAAKDGML